jgi:hypothetical protein
VPLRPGQGALAAAGRGRKRGVRVCELIGYPVRGLVFEAGDSLADLAAAVGGACQRLTAANVPHNLMIVDRGARVFLLPNAFAERKARGELPEGELQLGVPGFLERCFFAVGGARLPVFGRQRGL